MAPIIWGGGEAFTIGGNRFFVIDYEVFIFFQCDSQFFESINSGRLDE